MPEYLAPGVYVEEVDTGSKPIEGVSTSTVGMLGVTQKGKSVGLPELVTSFADFKRKFGGYLPTSFGDHRYLPYAVEGFFQNGGKRVYIMRVVPDDAEKSKNDSIGGGVITRLTKTVSSGNTINLATLRGIHNGSKVKLSRRNDDGTELDSQIKTVDSYDRSNNGVTLTGQLTKDYDKDMTIVTVAKLAQYGVLTDVGIPTTLDIYAMSKGKWGDDIKVTSKPVSRAKNQIMEIIASDTSFRYELKNSLGFYVGAIVVFDDGEDKQYKKVTAIDGKIITLNDGLTGGAGDIKDVTASPEKTISTCEFKLNVEYGRQSESFDYLSMNPATSNYCVKVVNSSSELIELTTPYGDFTNPSADEAAYNIAMGTPHPFDQPTNSSLDIIKESNGTDVKAILPVIKLSVGTDGTVAGLSSTEYKGTAVDGPGLKTGLKAMEDIDEVSILAVPGYTDVSLQKEMLIQCENLKDRFAILDIPEDKRKIQEVRDHRKQYDSKYGAVYHPWLKIYEPVEKRDIFVPPGGHMAGIYARSDIERGVHKAPANEVVRGIKDLKYRLNKGEQDILNPENINVIRDFRKSARGLRVWGARCITSDPDWKYVNVRRLFIFVEESIEEGTQWVVFEPNHEPTWARVRRSVSNFLTNVWRDGALQGATPEEAFFVRCDMTTMTQTDIDNGKLIMEIGIAPVKPAEFVIFRIGQWSGGSEVEEV